MTKEIGDNTARSGWQIGPGPVGGNVLGRQAGDAWEIIAPPGLGVEKPERLGEMAHWRFAVMSGGQLATKLTMGLDEVMGLAPDQEDWVFSVEVEALAVAIMQRPWAVEA
jgi:hypothetical protein